MWLGRRDLSIAAVPLQHLDLVAVGIGDEEEPRQQRAVAVELDDLARRQPGRLEAACSAVEIVDREGEVAVAVAELIGLARGPC